MGIFRTNNSSEQQIRKISNQIVEKEVIVEKIIEVPVEKIVTIEKMVTVEVPKEVYIDRPIEVIKEVQVEVIVEKEKIIEVEKDMTEDFNKINKSIAQVSSVMDSEVERLDQKTDNAVEVIAMMEAQFKASKRKLQYIMGGLFILILISFCF